MKKTAAVVIFVLSAVLGIMGCGAWTANPSETTEMTDSPVSAIPEPAATEGGKYGESAEEQTPVSAPQQDVLTEEQALEAVKNYCYINNPDLKDMEESGSYTIYWESAANGENEAVVLFRSYTGAEIRYYVDLSTGVTYVTELVPGIIDEETKTDESLNVRDYLN